MGNFAQQSLPILDEATLTVLRVNSSVPENFTVCASLIPIYQKLTLIASLPFADQHKRERLDR